MRKIAILAGVVAMALTTGVALFTNACASRTTAIVLFTIAALSGAAKRFRSTRVPGIWFPARATAKFSRSSSAPVFTQSSAVSG